ncbi:MAG: DUF4124 domain-containing protein [Betaproteobacteria bacterium]|nr:DUF4124 domain-containing protein [Betaproteobacteria bacterium]
MRERLFNLVVAAGLGLAATCAQAQIYKCVDAGGKTVYSQSPCPTGEKSRVITAPEAAPSAKAGTKSAADQDFDFRKRQKERDVAEKKSAAQAADEKRREEDCKRAREALAQYQLGGRISKIDDKGERYFLGEDEISQERDKAQAAVSQTCKGS